MKEVQIKTSDKSAFNLTMILKMNNNFIFQLFIIQVSNTKIIYRNNESLNSYKVDQIYFIPKLNNTKIGTSNISIYLQKSGHLF